LGEKVIQEGGPQCSVVDMLKSCEVIARRRRAALMVRLLPIVVDAEQDVCHGKVAVQQQV